MSLFATKQGTETFFRNHNIHPDKIRSFDDLSVSALSMGTYLGLADQHTDQQYTEALVLGVLHGINAIDTASNYRKQCSEKMLPQVFSRLEEMGVTRNQLFISSKAGFIPESVESDSHEGHIGRYYLEQGILHQKEIVQNCYSIAPKFLAEELEKSLLNMRLSCIDLYYINTPEIVSLNLGEEVFDERIQAAFALLEEKVAEGKVKNYGIATWNGFRQKSGTKGLLNLEKLLAFAKKIAGDNHHFRAIQLPLNMVMLEVLKAKNQSGKSIYEVAQENSLKIIISSPLMQSRVLSLNKKIFAQMPQELSISMQALQFVASCPWVTSVAVGMKSQAHVHENIKVLQRPNWSEESWENTKTLLGI